MKKVFIVIASLLMAVVITLLIVLNSLKKEVGIELENPVSISVYNKSNNPVIYDKEDAQYAQIMEKLNNVSRMSLFDRLLKLKTLEAKVEISKDDTYVKWNQEISNENYVVELTYNEEQDIVVYDGDYTRVISYMCIYFVFNGMSDFSDIAIYYSGTNDSTIKQEKYASCEPIIINGYTGDLVNYIKNPK